MIKFKDNSGKIMLAHAPLYLYYTMNVRAWWLHSIPPPLELQDVMSPFVEFLLCWTHFHKMLLSFHQSVLYTLKAHQVCRLQDAITDPPPWSPQRPWQPSNSHQSLTPTPFYFPALRSTLRSLPVGERQGAGVGGHHGDGGPTAGPHQRALARGCRAARPVSQNGSPGCGGKSGGCSQVGRFLFLAVSACKTSSWARWKQLRVRDSFLGCGGCIICLILTKCNCKSQAFPVKVWSSKAVILKEMMFAFVSLLSRMVFIVLTLIISE